MKVGNLQKQPWYVRFLVLGAVAALVYGGFWYFVTSGTRDETKKINEQVATLLQQNAQAQIASQRLVEFRALYASRQMELEELKALLPEQRELTNVLQNVQDRARRTNLSLRRFSPKDDIQQEFYSGKPIEVEVTSSFANLRSFYDQMAHYQRIVSISDFGLTQIKDDDLNKGKTINAKFTMTAYYVSAEKLKDNKAGQPAAPNAASPAAPTAPVVSTAPVH
jgi:Tfp pilus assembly protein PilO